MNNQPQGAAPRNDSFDIVTLYNPSTTPFEVWYNSELHTVIQPGKAVQLVKMIAGDNDHGATKHLVDRMVRQQLGAAGKNNPAARSAWLAKIVINQQANSLPVLPTVYEQAKALNEELANKPVDMPLPEAPLPQIVPTPPIANSGWKFDPLTGKPIENKPTGISPDQVDTSRVEIQTSQSAALLGTLPGAVLPHPDPETNTLLDNLRSGGEERVLGEQIINEDEPKVEPVATWPLEPTKEVLISYAEKVLLMNLSDDATRAQLEAQTPEQLKATLKYDPYA